MKCSLLRQVLALVLVCAGTVASVFAQSTGGTSAPGPREWVSFQGRLTDASGATLTGSFDFRFTLHDAADAGAVLATEEHLSVLVQDGAYGVNLGATIENLSEVLGGGARFVAIEVRSAGDTAYDLLAPRVPIASVPYAMTATQLAADMDTAAALIRFNDAGGFWEFTNDGTTFHEIGGEEPPDLIDASQIISGTIDAALLPANVMLSDATSLSLAGFVQIGAGLDVVGEATFLGTVDFSAASVTGLPISGLTGVLGAAAGGTGLSSYTGGGLLATTIGGLYELPGGADGDVLMTSGGSLIWTALPPSEPEPWGLFPTTLTDGSTRLDLAYEAGRVGIGTITPRAALEVVGYEASALALEGAPYDLVAAETGGALTLAGNGGNVEFFDSSTFITPIGDFQQRGHYTALGLPTAPLSNVGEGRLFFNSGTGTFQVSESGGEYVDLVLRGSTGGGGTGLFLPLNDAAASVSSAATFPDEFANIAGGFMYEFVQSGSESLGGGLRVVTDSPVTGVSAVVGEATYSFGSTIGVKGITYAASGHGLSGIAYDSTGQNYGAVGQTYSNNGVGVWGVALSTMSGFATGVLGETSSSTGVGVNGAALETTGVNYGVWGQSDSSQGVGVYGYVPNATGTTYGVFGQSDADAGIGVIGIASGTTGVSYGVVGQSSSTAGFGVFAKNDALGGIALQAEVFDADAIALVLSGPGVDITSGDLDGDLVIFPNGAGKVGVGTTTPSSVLHVGGPIATNVTTVTGTLYSVTDTDSVLLVDGGVTTNLTLPDPTTCPGRILYLRETSNFFQVTVDAAGAANIDGQASVLLDANGTLTLVSDGSQWWVIAAGYGFGPPA